MQEMVGWNEKAEESQLTGGNRTWSGAITMPGPLRDKPDAPEAHRTRRCASRCTASRIAMATLQKLWEKGIFPNHDDGLSDVKSFLERRRVIMVTRWSHDRPSKRRLIAEMITLPKRKSEKVHRMW